MFMTGPRSRVTSDGVSLRLLYMHCLSKSRMYDGRTAQCEICSVHVTYVTLSLGMAYDTVFSKNCDRADVISSNQYQADSV